MGNYCTACTGDISKNIKTSDSYSVTDSELFVSKSVSERAVPPAEAPREKRPRSARRSPPKAPTIRPADRAVLESWIEQKKASVTVATTTAKAARAATATKLAGAPFNRSGRAVRDAAAVMIQSAFRSYLARKALRALKGLVKVQALVRGHLVRKRTTAALRRMQSLATVQARARAQRTRMGDESNSNVHRTPARKSVDRLSRHQEIDRGVDENIRIVEMDLGGSNRSTSSSRKSFSGHPPTAQQTNRRSSSSIPNRANSKQEPRDLSLKPSALIESRPRAQSMRYDDYYLDTAKTSQQSSPRYSWSENPAYAQVQPYQRTASHPTHLSKQERKDILLLQVQQALVDASPRAESERFIDYHLDTAQSSPRASSTMSKPEYPSYDYNVTAPGGVGKKEQSNKGKKLERSKSAPRAGGGSVAGGSGRKKVAQARTRPDSNVDPWLAKLAEVGGPGKKRDRGASSNSHANTVYGSSRGSWKF